MSRRLFRPDAGAVICQIDGPWDGQRRTRLPAQCCGLPADQIYKCEQVAAPGHRCQVDDHTILHERMGNGRSCADVEYWLRERGGLYGWVTGLMPGEPPAGPPTGEFPLGNEGMDHSFEGDGQYCQAWIDLGSRGDERIGVITMRAGCGYPRDTHPGPADHLPADQGRGD
jgi:hypothetical protein